MAAPTLYRAAGDEFSTTLSSSCTAGDLTMSLNSATGLNSSGGMLIIDEGVANKEEVIAYSSVASTTLTIPSGGRGLSGTTAYAHSSGATVTDIIVSDHVNKLITSLTSEHNEDGTHKTLTNLVLVTPTITNNVKFRVSRNAAANTGNSAFAVVAFDTEQYDSGNNVASGVFTAPASGYYQFNWAITITCGVSATFGCASLYINGVEYSRGNGTLLAASTASVLTGSDLVYITSGQTADIRAYGASTMALSVGNTNLNYFSGCYVSS
jgi:hypothetical protein